MRGIIAVCILLAGATGATAQSISPDRMYLGVGRWTCERFGAAHSGENPTDQAQAAGWVLGFWSATTFYEGKAFTDMVETAGGRGIFDLTAQLCARNPTGLVGAATKALLENTRAQAQ